MSIEPTCDFCGYSDKLRCKTMEKAVGCDQYQQKMALEASVRNTTKKKDTPKMASKSVENLAEMATRAGRGMSGLVDAMSTRGAIKGEELFAVGQLREQALQLVQLAEAVQSEIAAEAESKS